MSAYVAGIDGGQSSTTAAIGDETGRIVGRGVAGPADEIGAGADSTRLHDALRDALDAACADARLPHGTHFAAVVAGVSGYEGRIYGRAPDLPATRFVLMHDAPVAHAGALAGKPGVVVIAGTGSVVYATDGRRGTTTGGWGFLFGDEGSAFWLCREALAQLMRDEDDDPSAKGHGSAEARAACEYFRVPTLRVLARAIYAGEISRDRLAAFASEVCAMPKFSELVARGAGRLAELAGRAIEAGAAPAVAGTGGMFLDGAFRRRFDAALLDRAGGAVELVEPRYPPSLGALLLAYREAGIPVDPQS